MMIFRFIFILLSVAVSLQVNAQSDSYEVWKKQVLVELGITPVNESGDVSYAYGNDTSTVRNLVKRRTKEAKGYIVTHDDSPQLYWILGAIGQYQYIFYTINVENERGYYNPNSPNAKALREKEYQSYYRKALDLDDNPVALEHLDPSMLHTMTRDVFSPLDIVKRAYRKALDISIADGRSPFGGEVGNYELELYEFFLGTYADEGDNKLYLATINEVLERYPNYRTEELLTYKSDVEATIAKQKQATTQDSYAQADTYSAPKPVAAEPTKAVKPKKVAEPVVENQRAPASDNTMLWWLLGGGIGLLGVIVLLMRRKQS